MCKIKIVVKFLFHTILKSFVSLSIFERNNKMKTGRNKNK